MNPLNDQLLGALVGLSRASESKEISESAGAPLRLERAVCQSEEGRSGRIHPLERKIGKHRKH